jgi:hypothetical protein
MACRKMAGLVAGNDAALEKGQPHGLADDQSDLTRRCFVYGEHSVRTEAPPACIGRTEVLNDSSCL